ncbi:WxL domain-containing protein [uncultured Vagococcus sp.]|uniref:WxL domain-containing protein n=1 Tax=uncultured Vagococcus sp. TaxID=189676 RepID=UPI0028D7E10A|nr:WxL domain-containing protein [uncultured Vagococcus sp.]
MKKQLCYSACLLSLLALPVSAIAADGGSIKSNATVTIEKNTGEEGEPPVNPVDPTETVKPAPGEDGEENPHEPSTKGPLSLNYVSNFQFGRQKANGNDMTYQVKPDRVVNAQGELIEVPNFIQITDHRGSNAGWSLMVKQNSPFKNGAHTLDGTEMVFSHPVLSSKSGSSASTPKATTQFTLTGTGESALVVAAKAEQGMGTWANRFGEDNQQAKSSVQLNIPGESKKVAGFYQTSLTWTLADTPVSD